MSPPRNPSLCFLAEHYPPTDGGVATSAQRLARALAAEGVQVRLFCFDPSRPVTAPDYMLRENDSGVLVHRVGPFFTKQPRGSEPLSEKQRATLRRRAFAQVTEVLAPNPPALVLSYYLLNAGYLAQFVAREFRVPHVAGVRGNDIGRNIFNVERFGVIHWLVQSAQRLVCVNEHLRGKLLLAFPEAAPRTSVVVNTTAFAPSSEEAAASARERVAEFTQWQKGCVRLCFIGTLREKKGLATLLLALRELQAGETEARLLVVGPEPTPSELKTCRKLWEDLAGQGRVVCTGWRERAEVPQWAAGCDAVVMPSLDDGMANGLLEGMALGLCPVVSDVFAEIIRDGEEGLVTPRGDASALAAAIVRLGGDRSLGRRLGSAARGVALRRTPADEAAAYLNIFREVLAGAPAASSP